MAKILEIAEIRQAIQVSWVPAIKQMADRLTHLCKYLKGVYLLNVGLVQSDHFYLNIVASFVVFVST